MLLSRFHGHRLLKGKKCLAPASTLRFLGTVDQSERNIVKSVCPDVEIPKLNFFDFLWSQNIEKWGKRTALVNGITEESFSFIEGKEESVRCATMLVKEFGLAKGDVVALLLPNGPEYVFLTAGAALIGAPITTVNPMYTSKEIANQIQMSHAKVVVTMESFVPSVKDALRSLKSDMKIISLDSNQDTSQVRSYQAIREKTTPNLDCRAKNIDENHDDFGLFFSSGTTGLPKGVQLTHHNLIANSFQTIYAKDFGFIKFPTESFQPTTVMVLPLFHIYGFFATMTTLYVGGKVVHLPSFNPETFTSCLKKNKPNFLHLVPPLVSFCANHPMVTGDHLEQLDSVIVGAAPVGRALIEQFKKKASHVCFKEAWGMTELSPAATFTPEYDEVSGSCGMALPNTYLKVIDLETGENLGPGQRGELCVKGPQVMKGYLNNKEATDFTKRDGWLHSGDIAYYDEKGHIFIVDRLKELIKVKGLQVAPAELENLLRKHPGVNDNAVIGVSHDTFGEVPRAYIVKGDPTLTEKAIHDYVNENVAEFKRLVGGIKFVETIPRSASGKILRRVLVSDYKDNN